MAKMNFSEWLKTRFKDEAKLTPEEMQYLVHCHRSYLLDPDLPPGKDASGAVLSGGEVVKIEYRVTAVNPWVNPQTGAIDQDITVLNLAKILPDGKEEHAISVKSNEVTKIQ